MLFRFLTFLVAAPPFRAVGFFPLVVFFFTAVFPVFLLAGAFRVFFATAFLAAAFLTGGFLAADFLGDGVPDAAFLAEGFLADVFLAGVALPAVFLAPPDGACSAVFSAVF